MSLIALTLPGINPGAQQFLSLTPVVLPDQDNVLTVDQLLHGLLSSTPTADRDITFPTSAALVRSLPGVQVGNVLMIYLRNLSGMGDILTIVVPPGSGTVDGDAGVLASARAIFALRLDSVTPGSELYTVFELVNR